MKNFLATLLIGLSFAVTAHAQTLTGKVEDTKNQPIEFANVALYSLPDSMLVTGTVTNQEGEFSLMPNSAKDAFLKISFIGYETRMLPAISGQTIVLQNSRKLLEEVVVKGNRKLFELENGAIVASVKNTVLETLSNANEVIAQLPFLSGRDGDFTVFGKGTPVIYINNRLVSNNKELEQLSPSDIKNIKVITSPGAAYDATVKAVIKITTEKPVGEGLSGMFYTQGEQASVFSGREQASLNYRTGAWDIFGSTFFKHNHFKTDFSAIQRMTLPDNEQEQIYLTDERGRRNSLYSVLELNFNPHNRLSAGIRYTNNTAKYRNNVTNDITYTNNGDIENILQETTVRSPRNTHNVNAY